MESEHSEECLARQHKDNVGYLAGHALAGILANSSGAFGKLGFDQTVDLAARYAEALAKRLDNPPQAEV
jgi:hypothetical protein